MEIFVYNGDQWVIQPFGEIHSLFKDGNNSLIEYKLGPGVLNGKVSIVDADNFRVSQVQVKTGGKQLLNFAGIPRPAILFAAKGSLSYHLTKRNTVLIAQHQALVTPYQEFELFFSLEADKYYHFIFFCEQSEDKFPFADRRDFSPFVPSLFWLTELRRLLDIVPSPDAVNSLLPSFEQLCRLLHEESKAALKLPLPEQSAPTDETVFWIAEEIVLRHDVRIDLNQLCRQFHLTIVQMNYMFKRNFGLTVYAFHMMLRLERAKHLLGDSDLSFKDIAHQTGFSGLSHFSRTIRQKTGFSPSEIRKRNGMLAGDFFAKPWESDQNIV